MLEHEIMAEARKLMDRHGLPHWKIKRGRGVKLAGLCSYRERAITLSMKLLPTWPREDVIDTILHEIAHALAGSGAGHGPDWKAVCRRIGANPERCWDSVTLPTVEGKWTQTCGCGMVNRTVHRRKAKLVCRACSGPILYHETGADPSTAMPYRGSDWETKARECAEEHGVTYTWGAFWSPKGKVFRNSGTHCIDPSLDYYKGSGKWKTIYEELSDGLEDCECSMCARETVIAS